MPSWLLQLTYIMFTLIGSAFSTKLILLDTDVLSANTLILPACLLLLVFIKLRFGFKFAFKTLMLSLVLNILFVLYGYLITHMPAPAYAVNNAIFNPILAENAIVIAHNLILFFILPLAVLLAVHVLYLFKVLHLSPHIYKESSILSGSKYLSLLVILYTTAIVSASWYDPRLLKISWFEVGSGALTFPLTCIFLDMITEVYGYKNARVAIWCGFVFNLLVLIFGQIMAHWSANNPTNYAEYHDFLLFNLRVIIASLVSYFATEMVSAYILAKLKIRLHGRFMALRFLSSTAVGYFLDVVVFCLIAFYGTMGFHDFVHFNFTSWSFMVGIEIILLPLSTLSCKLLKRLERLDIYDQDTHFTLLSLEHKYAHAQNKFHGKKKIA